MSGQPLVSVICVCYNHERFVAEAVLSVLNQSYQNIELIVVDDCSTDNSVDIIRKMNVTLIALQENKGYCAAFNEGWKACKGDYVIDLAADDELLPDRVKTGVDEFSKRDETYGVQFTDALYSTGYRQSDRFPNPPQGDLYTELIKKYFICAASMMSRRSVLTKLDGYDASLAYEDFDFWIRSSRQFKYFYTPEVLVKKRVVKGSMSEQQFKRGNVQQLSTYRVCEKIKLLNKTSIENKALRERIWYEIRQSIVRMDLSLATKYFHLLKSF